MVKFSYIYFSIFLIKFWSHCLISHPSLVFFIFCFSPRNDLSSGVYHGYLLGQFALNGCQGEVRRVGVCVCVCVCVRERERERERMRASGSLRERYFADKKILTPHGVILRHVYVIF